MIIDTISKIDTQELLLRIQKGDEEAFSVLYDKYSPSLYGLILKIVKQEDLANDILQDCFVKIWQKINQFDPNKGTIFTWMLNICRNKSIDSLRSFKREFDGKNRMSESSVNMEKEEEINVNAIGLKDIINKLPEEKRIIVEYLYFRGYTQQETSEELEIPLGTVKTRARGAIQALKEYFILILAYWISNNT